ncbi:hypothetical protein DH2020_012854 [Rehmannia glutinosa]|uniref:KIB1-4 beta-propeller domain-containing protein n=1 Tax=Rehmannia glutinosa TaxID=99300 RepID=A0ABR0X199_REHGL
MVYRFIVLERIEFENRVLGLKKRGEEDEDSDEEWPDDKAKIVCSSHGWLALFHFQNDNYDLFLSNSLSRRNIKLPPIQNLLNIPESILKGGYLSVTNVIISSSSLDEEDCRVMVIYGRDQRLAFCCPARARVDPPQRSDWLRVIGDSGDHFVAWDLRDPLSPRMIPMVISVDKNNYPVAAQSELELDLKLLCKIDEKFLVVAEPSDELFHVRRFVMLRMGPDGSFVDEVWHGAKGFDYSVPYKTVGFDVQNYEPETGSLKYMDRSLGGLALFIGSNHGFALSGAHFPELKPNSIYFTDTIGPPEWDDHDYRGHNVGIFNYENETFWSFYYPIGLGSIRKIVPSPIWFTPTTPL